MLESGYDVWVIAPGDTPGNMSKSGFRHLPLRKIKHHFFPYKMPLLSLFRASTSRFINCLQAAWLLSRCRPSVVISIEPDAWALATFLKPFFHYRLIVDIQEVYEDRFLAFPSRIQKPLIRLFRSCVQLLTRATDEVIHVSPERQALYEYSGKSGVVVVYYPTKAQFTTARTSYSRRRDSSSGRFVNIVHAGSLRLSYCGDLLLQAMEKVCAQHSGIRLFIIGGLSGESWFRQSALLLRLCEQKKVLIIDPVPFERMLKLYAIADIGINLVKPIDQGHYWAQPRKLYEYLAAGVPVIGADLPTIRNVLQKHDCGEVVDPCSVHSIAEGILRLAQDPSRRRACSQNARRAFESVYNWEAQETGLLRVLGQFCAGSTARQFC
jgi:glycosyltransferase involved in cell wall biosynthesis